MAEKEIMVCNDHEAPLIWTFMFTGAEYFCMAGNHAGGMLGTGHRVPLTPELKEQYSLYKRRWGQLRRHIVVSRFWLKGCDRCADGKGSAHIDHLTDEEKRRSKMALAKLEAYADGR